MFRGFVGGGSGEVRYPRFGVLEKREINDQCAEMRAGSQMRPCLLSQSDTACGNAIKSRVGVKWNDNPGLETWFA